MVRDVPAGTLIDGRYRVVQRVGSGGMADVYLAEDTQLGRSVAVKLLHRRFAEDREFVERFRREASSAAGLEKSISTSQSCASASGSPPLSIPPTQISCAAPIAATSACPMRPSLPMIPILAIAIPLGAVLHGRDG